MHTSTHTAAHAKRYREQGEDRAFFYVEGIPTNGIWLDLDDVDSWSDIHEALQRAGLIGEDFDGDTLVADIEGDITKCCYSSSYDLFDLNRYIELRDAVNQSGFDKAAVAVFIGWFGSWDADTFESAFMGQHDSEQAYAEQYIDETGMLDDVPQHLRCYFDYEAFARDLFMGGYYFDGGFVFCCNC
jgi:hypothetical protein